ncbi:hypothetical protein HMPREF0591_1332 [Mycobacterium parascrofulaceum ATCC BAA-614]|uniref:Uncharacterized protein n=1 Tax=Mycobacterium parascrofulaceum ATCC BAA-614 TaxID=525368 RepID=D5P588_9MYCO|nr:hypothetical protein HMPREF0591_1332 [Mycobacterium parascrofulaceum ATCC BAA-614]
MVQRTARRWSGHRCALPRASLSIPWQPRSRSRIAVRARPRAKPDDVFSSAGILLGTELLSAAGSRQA